MKNSQVFKFGILMLFVIGFQKLVAQPHFIIEDKVVFVTSSATEANVTFAAKQKQSSAIIEDTVVFANANSNGGVQTVKLDSIHSRLVKLKKVRAEKATSFNWFTSSQTPTTNIEGYNIVVMSKSLPAKVIAEVRFARQKDNVWIDKKGGNGPNQVETVKYSEQYTKADIETYDGIKLSLSINTKTGTISIHKLALTSDVLIHKTAKLF